MKKLIALLLCLAMALPLFGCEAGTGPDTTGEATDTSVDTGAAPDTSLDTGADSDTDADVPMDEPVIEGDGATVIYKLGSVEMTFAEFNFQFSYTPSYWIYSAKMYGGDDYKNMLIQRVGFDPDLPYKDQKVSETDDVTFYDSFFNYAMNYVSETAALCNYAAENGIALSDEEIKECDDRAKTIEEQAIAESGSLAEAYCDKLGLTTLDVMRTIIRKETLARKTLEVFNGNTDITDEDIAKEYEANPKYYSTVDYLNFTFSTGDNITADDVKKYSEELAATKTPEEFLAYVKNYCVNVSKTDPEGTGQYDISAYQQKKIPYTEGFDRSEWMFGGAKVGESRMEMSSEGTTCTVFMLTSEPSLGDYVTKNVRHILFLSSNYDSEDKCKEEAERIYKQYLLNPTEDNFADLANKYSDDPDLEYDDAGNAVGQKETKESGGLYENVERDKMVKPFEDWCYDEARKPGDTGIIKSDYGYHIMYFVGDGKEISTGKDAIRNALLQKKFQEYMAGLEEVVDTDYLAAHLPTSLN